MKKLIPFILALCLLLSFASAEGNTAVQEGIPSEAEFRELNRRIWEANLFDSVISRHKSYIIRWDYSYVSFSQCTYQTKDACYSEWSYGSMEYIRSDGFGCNAYPDEDTELATLEAFVDVAPELNIHVQASADTLEESFVFGHDTLTGIEKNDNRIHIYSRYDEELSRAFFEQWLETENPGMTVTTESVLDAETLEQCEFFYRGEKDGETVVLASIAVEYDVPEPMACWVLRSILEADSPNMRTCRYVVEPDTEEERIYEITLPVNLPLNVYATPGNTYAAFEDKEGTLFVHPDYLNDRTIYVFLHPDEEMMQRYLEQFEVNGTEE